VRKDEEGAFDGDVFEVMDSLASFESFKEKMLAHKVEAEGSGVRGQDFLVVSRAC
jgi:hypothetical protein